MPPRVCVRVCDVGEREGGGEGVAGVTFDNKDNIQLTWLIFNYKISDERIQNPLECQTWKFLQKTVNNFAKVSI